MANKIAVDCKHPPGHFKPIISPLRCEGKEDCVQVCPVNVFEVRKLEAEEKRGLPLAVRVKLWAHGNKQAFAVRAEACEACGLCVTACPENAITLARATP